MGNWPSGKSVKVKCIVKCSVSAQWNVLKIWEFRRDIASSATQNTSGGQCTFLFCAVYISVMGKS